MVNSMKRTHSNNYQMKRGQAFETIMMVIAVIVALAILGFLTGILENLGTMFNPSDPVKTMTSALSGAGSYNSGTSPQVLSFTTAGQKINTIQLTQNTQWSSNNVYFVCTPALAQTKSISVVQQGSGATSSQVLTINNKVTVEMVVCGNSAATLSGGTQPLYVIALGMNGDTSGTATACYNAFAAATSFPSPNCGG